MSPLTDLNSISESEKTTLKRLLLDRIAELEEKKARLNNNPDDTWKARSRIVEVEKLIKFNTYLFHWVEDPNHSRLQ